jgi:hypothetical protein
MWIAGVSPLSVLEAYIAAALALVIFGIPAAHQQQRYSPIIARRGADVRDRRARVFIVAFILVTAIVVNVVVNLHFNALADAFRSSARRCGSRCCCACRCAAATGRSCRARSGLDLPAVARARRVDDAGRALPDASWRVALGLGFVSAVFDNIPLTALALKQGGYDWGFVAVRRRLRRLDDLVRLVAGVALTNQYPEAKSVFAWIRGGWHVDGSRTSSDSAVMLVVHRMGAGSAAARQRAGRDGAGARKVGASRRAVRVGVRWRLRRDRATIAMPIALRRGQPSTSEDLMKKTALALALLAAATTASAQITLFEHDNFSGRRFDVRARSTTSATAASTTSHRRCSIRQGTWQVCDDAYFRGRCVTLQPGE